MATASDLDLLAKIETVDKVQRREHERAKRDQAAIAAGIDPYKQPWYAPGDAEFFRLNPDAESLAMLKSVGLNSVNDAKDLPGRLLVIFVNRVHETVSYMLAQNEKIARKEMERYTGNDATPDIDALRNASAELADASHKIFEFQSMLTSPRKKGESVAGQVAGELADRIKDFAEKKRVHGAQFPILMAEGLDYRLLSRTNRNAVKAMVSGPAQKAIDNIGATRNNLASNALDPLKLPRVYDESLKLLGVKAGMSAYSIIDKQKQVKETNETVKQLAEAALAISLGIMAGAASGGLAFLAAAGGAGIGAVGAYQGLKQFEVESAASRSAIGSAAAISADQPDAFWLAVSIAGAVIDAGAALKAFRGCVQSIKAAKTVEEVERAAQGAATAVEKKLAPGVSKEAVVTRIVKGAEVHVLKAAKDSKRLTLVEDVVKTRMLGGKKITTWNDAACRALLKEHGEWKGLIEGLVAQGPDGNAIAVALNAHRKRLLVTLEKKFGAKPLEEASEALVSDVDLNIGAVKPGAKPDAKAGAKVLAAEAYMAKEFGSAWSAEYRMAFYTDRSRLISYSLTKGLSPEKKAEYMKRVLKEVGPRSSLLNEAKALSHAKDDASAIASSRARCNALGLDFEAVKKESLRLTAGDVAGDRAAALKKVDGLVQKLDAPGLDEAKRLDLAKEITLAQMEANFLSHEAYIGPGAMLGIKGLESGMEAFTAAHSQIEMMTHILGQCDHDVVRAMREYELYKYINRFAEVSVAAKVADAELEAFGRISEYVYRTNRAAQQGAGITADVISDSVKKKGGGFYVRPTDLGVEGAKFTPDTLRMLFQSWEAKANQTLPKLKQLGDKAVAP